jgi:hypothetical protein
MRLRSLVVVGVLTLLVTGCGSAAETIIENAPGASGQDDVDTEIDDDGETVRIDVENEGGSGSVQIGGDQDLPDDFPVPLPDGGQVVQSMESQMGDQSVFQVIVRYEDRSHEALVEYFTDYFEQYEDTFMSTTTGATELAIFQSADAELTVQVITDSTGTQVSVSNIR